MLPRFQSARSTVLVLAVASLSGVAACQSVERTSASDCVRQVSPPSSAPHDVFRRVVCVAPREGRSAHRAPAVVERTKGEAASAASTHRPDQEGL